MTTLSSAQTVLMKFVLPPVWTLVVGAAALGLWSSRSGAAAAPLVSRVLVPLAWVLGSILIWRLCVPLKRVQLDERTLLISDYRSTIRVPAGDIAEVTENRWISMHPVTLHFRRPTEFGSDVVFMPKVRPFGFVSSHPVVAELRALAQGGATQSRSRG